MAESASVDETRRLVGVDISAQDVDALLAWYAGLARGIAAFPEEDLRRVEPPLRSVPGPVLA